MAISDLDEIRVLWATIAELQRDIRPSSTGHIRTTITVLLEHLRMKELGLSDVDRVALALIIPNRWEHDYTLDLTAVV